VGPVGGAAVGAVQGAVGKRAAPLRSGIARHRRRSRLDDTVEGAAVDHQVLDDREGFRAPGLQGERVAVPEMAHVELADGGVRQRTVRLAVDHEAAGAADALAAVVIEGDRVFLPLDQMLVEQHLQEGAVLVDTVRLVAFHAAGLVGAGLTPDVEREIDHL